MRKIITTTLIAAAAIAGLTACTSGSSTTSETPTPRPTITSGPAVDGYTPPTGQCEDGVATITADLETIALPEGCETVNVLTNASTITLGPVTNLQIEGDDNAVTVASVDKITVFGTGNDLKHGGDAEKVDDQGKHNTIAKQ